MSAGTASVSAVDAEQHFAEVVDDLLAEPGVTPPGAGRGFGRSALRVDGRIFAMLVRGSFVVKLPRARVAELIDSGAGVPFDANKGAPMKEWLALDSAASEDWTSLAREALAFVR